MTDTDDITALFDRMCSAWTAGDAVAYGACFTADCDYVSFDGTRAEGRDAVIASHDALFRGVLLGSALVGHVESVRPITPDAAVVHGTGSVLVAWRSRTPRRRLTRNTLVAVREPDGWRFAAIHNGRIRPMTVPPAGSAPARAARGLVRAASALGLGHHAAGSRSRPAARR